MTQLADLREGIVLSGALFPEPVRVETVRSLAADMWEVGVVGLRTDRFRRLTLTPADLATVKILERSCSFAGDGSLLRLGLQGR
jgi:hypothetical protein